MCHKSDLVLHNYDAVHYNYDFHDHDTVYHTIKYAEIIVIIMTL